MKCANCDRDALYVYQVTKESSIYYCNKDLPSFLEERKKAGLLKITESFTTQQKSAIDNLSHKPVATEEQAEPKPVKKAAKKPEN